MRRCTKAIKGSGSENPLTRELWCFERVLAASERLRLMGEDIPFTPTREVEFCPRG